MKNVYIYILTDPTNVSTSAYIGKTEDLKQRMRMHRSEAHKGKKTHKCFWLRSLFRRGVESPDLTVLEEMASDADWKEAERFWISYFRFIGLNLVNGTEGGEGMDATPETRRKISIALTGKHPSEETKRKIGAASLGRRFSAESKLRMSLKRKGVPKRKSEKYKTHWTDQRRAEQALKMAEVGRRNKGKKFSPEVCLKRGASRLGVKRSPEAIEAARQGTLRSWARRKAASAAIPAVISEQQKEEPVKRTTIYPNGATQVTEAPPEEFALYDRELMKQMVALLNDEEEQEDTEPKEADESSSN